MLDIIILIAVLFIFMFSAALVEIVVEVRRDIWRLTDLVDKMEHDVVVIKKWAINKGYEERFMEVDPMGYTE